MLKRPALLLLFGLVALVPGAAAAQQISEAADKVLWCGSAFFWLATNASDSGDEAEAEQYQTWSDALMAKGVALLKSDKLDANAIEHVVDAYDNAVVAELGTPRARHDVTTCPALVLPK